MNAILWAARAGRVAILKHFDENYCVKPEDRTDVHGIHRGSSAAHEAGWHGHPQAFRYLCEQQPELKDIPDHSGFTPVGRAEYHLSRCEDAIKQGPSLEIVQGMPSNSDKLVPGKAASKAAYQALQRINFYWKLSQNQPLEDTGKQQSGMQMKCCVANNCLHLHADLMASVSIRHKPQALQVWSKDAATHCFSIQVHKLVESLLPTAQPVAGC